MEPSSTNVNDPPTAAEDLANLVRYAQRITEWTAGKSFTDYQADTMLSDATERNLIEVGNIIHRFETTAPQLYQQLPVAVDWYAFRIRLDHVRWRIDQTVVWDTIQRDLPVLMEAAEGLLQLNDEG